MPEKPKSDSPRSPQFTTITPNDTIKIEALSKRLSDLATRVSQQIVTFERWLQEMPGKVPVVTKTGSAGRFFYLSFHRHYSGWALFVAIAATSDSKVEYTSLREADLDKKLDAIELFPAFIVEVAAAQELRVNRLVTAEAQLGALAKTLGIAQEEGK